MNERPPFVVLEGLDGAGTTTQTRAVAQALCARGVAVWTTREPSDGPIGVQIREIIGLRITLPGGAPVSRSTLALLFAADRLHHVDAEIGPALDRGEVVISDRYAPSSYVYQGDIDGSDQVDYAWVRQLNERALVPDLTIFLEADVELCLSRLADRGDRDIFETREKLSRLATRYEEVMSFLQAEGHRVLRLSAERPIEELTGAIVEGILAL
jgi:dTMP kinase